MRLGHGSSSGVAMPTLLHVQLSSHIELGLQLLSMSSSLRSASASWLCLGAAGGLALDRRLGVGCGQGGRGHLDLASFAGLP